VLGDYTLLPSPECKMAGYRLNEVPHPQVRFAFGMSKWNPPPMSCPV